MFSRKGIFKTTPFVLAGALAFGAFAAGVRSQSTPQAAPTAATAPSTTGRPQPARLDKRAVAYYATVWGIEDPTVKWAEAGELIRFSYRIIDAEKAKILNDKNIEPSLVDPQAGVKLVVPSMDNVGALRQVSTPIAGKVYWMAFSNSGRPVRRGDHVDITIGNFHAAGLIVE